MYDFESGDLSLDFANTKDWHASQKPVENLTDYNDLITWGQQAGVIDAKNLLELQQHALDDPSDALRAYAVSIQLREAIYGIFSALYAGESIPPDELELLNNFVRQANAHVQVCHKGEDCKWEWTPDAAGANLILWSVARAAAQLLTSPMASRVRECEDDRGCGYLFIDQTKNHSRRWCSMESCGNRAKARRHYSRVQAG